VSESAVAVSPDIIQILGGPAKLFYGSNSVNNRHGFWLVLISSFRFLPISNKSCFLPLMVGPSPSSHAINSGSCGKEPLQKARSKEQPAKRNSTTQRDSIVHVSPALVSVQQKPSLEKTCDSRRHLTGNAGAMK